MPKLNIRNRIFLVISVTTLLSVAFLTSGDNSIEIDQPKLKAHRYAVILEGQLEQALKFAKESTEYIDKNYPGHNIQVYREVEGEGGKIHWFMDFKNMEDLEEFGKKILADAEYKEMFVNFEEVFETSVGVFLQSIY